MKKIYYADNTEKQIGEILEKAGIRFVHESEDNTLKLDFYLPDYGIYIEVKRFYSNRSSKQLSSEESIIFIQGVKSVMFFKTFISDLSQCSLNKVWDNKEDEIWNNE